jgi:adenylate cyclase
MKKNAILIVLGLLIVLVFVGNATERYYRLNFIDQLSAVLYDYSLQLTMPSTLDERIVILDIDEKSLQEEGRWPWSRDRLALLVDKLFDNYGIAVAGFDVVFAENDESSGLKVLQRLGQNQLKDNAEYQSVLAHIQPQLEYDALFASKIRNRKVVLGYYLSNRQEKSSSGMLPEAVFQPGSFQDRPIAFLSWNGYGANLPELQHAAASAGHFNPVIDADGAVRRVPMLAEYDGAYYESLSMAVVRTLIGNTNVSVHFSGDSDDDYTGLEWLGLATVDGTLKIPVDSNVATYVPYRGKQGSFRYISATDVLHDRVEPEQLNNKIVLIGTSAIGLLDNRATPVSETFPGVEIHANMVAGILDQNLKQHPAYMLGVEVVWLLVIGIVLSVALPRLSPANAMLVSFLMFAATVGLSLSLWQYGDLLMPMANSLVMITLLFALDMSYGYFVEARTKRQITGLFGQYVPSEVVEEMSHHPESVSMKGESREMTILFSDVRGFTTISEGLGPEELTELMNEFLTPLSRVVYKHHGTIDKYMGDCIMAFWGAPLPDTQHARDAILAGIEMQATLDALQPHFRERGWPEIHVGVGINTGRVSVGNMGSEVRVAYTVMGDEVNLASRLEGITKQYGVGIVVGEHTRNAVTDFVYRELDHVRVRGKNEPVAIYEPIGLLSAVSQAMQDEVALFHEMRHLYCAQEWDQAGSQLTKLQQMSPDTRLYGVYAERIAHFRKNPPAADWDGVFVFQTK